MRVLITSKSGNKVGHYPAKMVYPLSEVKFLLGDQSREEVIADLAELTKNSPYWNYRLLADRPYQLTWGFE